MLARNWVSAARGGVRTDNDDGRPENDDVHSIIEYIGFSKITCNELGKVDNTGKDYADANSHESFCDGDNVNSVDRPFAIFSCCS